jgi:hypothetical protein
LFDRVGHNLGLNHAGLGSDQYGDETDVMGYVSVINASNLTASALCLNRLELFMICLIQGAFQQFGPSKCFNGAHIWNLGWFSDKTVTIDAFTHTIIQIASFADYSKLEPGQYVDVNVGPFYLVFNRASGVNAGTGAVPNTVSSHKDGLALCT